MSGIAAYLRQLDDAWSHRWESLLGVLDGVTEEAAFWQAPAYRDEEPEDGWPPPGSIAWQVAHVAHCKRHYTDCVRHAGQEGRPPVRPWTPCATFAALLDVLREAHAEQRAAIEALGDGRLDLVAGNGMPMPEFLAMCIRHDTWHAAQIAVARRLHRTRTATEALGGSAAD